MPLKEMTVELKAPKVRLADKFKAWRSRYKLYHEIKKDLHVYSYIKKKTNAAKDIPKLHESWEYDLENKRWEIIDKYKGKSKEIEQIIRAKPHPVLKGATAVLGVFLVALGAKAFVDMVSNSIFSPDFYSNLRRQWMELYIFLAAWVPFSILLPLGHLDGKGEKICRSLRSICSSHGEKLQGDVRAIEFKSMLDNNYSLPPSESSYKVSYRIQPVIVGKIVGAILVPVPDNDE